MNVIKQADLVALGGAPDARYAIFEEDGSLYFCTTSKEAYRDEDYWSGQRREIKQVVFDLETA